MAQIGQIVDGKYKVLQLIGKGGMSRVYLGEDIRLKKKWAIKEIPKITGGKKNALFINAAVKEVQIIKSLDHPYIVRIIDVAEDIRSVYIIEDLVQGRSLRKAVQDEEILSESQLIKWALMIC